MSATGTRDTVEGLAAELAEIRERRATFSGLATEQDLADDRRLTEIEELLGLPEGALDISERDDDEDYDSEELD